MLQTLKCKHFVDRSLALNALEALALAPIHIRRKFSKLLSDANRRQLELMIKKGDLYGRSESSLLNTVNVVLS